MALSARQLKMGGQAVIEGVMMRAEDQWAVAVRRPNGEIAVRKESWRPVGRRFKLLELPFLRGMVILVETLVLGVKALSFSAEVAAEEEEDGAAESDAPQEKQQQGLWWSISMAATVAFSLALGLVIFFYLPLLLTELTGIENPTLFNIVDGVLRIAFFLGYLLIISRWDEIGRVFEYHGAEHMSIRAFEARKKLTWENIREYSRFHPRCGTSFVLVLLVFSIFIFMFFGKPADWSERLLRMLAVPLIAGISYELIKLSDRYPDHPVARALAAPGLWLQHITTRQPDEGQVEVAVTALRSALAIEGIELEEMVAAAAAAES